MSDDAARKELEQIFKNHGKIPGVQEAIIISRNAFEEIMSWHRRNSASAEASPIQCPDGRPDCTVRHFSGAHPLPKTEERNEKSAWHLAGLLARGEWHDAADYILSHDARKA